MTTPGHQSQSQPEEEEEAEEDEAEELGHAETYADYVPSKCEYPGDAQQATSGLHSPRGTGFLKVPGPLNHQGRCGSCRRSVEGQFCNQVVIFIWCKIKR